MSKADAWRILAVELVDLLKAADLPHYDAKVLVRPTEKITGGEHG